ncbi:MAG: hypothetical protein ACREDR_02550, partial [Blastocatellia bacterium]
MKAPALIDKLIKIGWTKTGISIELSVQPKTVRAWHKGDWAPKPTTLAQLANLLKVESVRGDQRKGRRGSDVPKRAFVGSRSISTPRERADFFRELLSVLEMTRDELAIRLGISTRSVDNLLSIYYKQPVSAVVDTSVIEALVRNPPPNLDQRFHEAAKKIFGHRYHAGFRDEWGSVLRTVKWLCEVTGYNERTLRRYLPPYGNRILR